MKHTKNQPETIAEIQLETLLEAPFRSIAIQAGESEQHNSQSMCSDQFRLFHLKELSHDDNTPPREALENVFSSIDIAGGRFVYLLDGRKDGVDIYFGTVSENRLKSLETGRTLEHALQGNFSGIEVESLVNKKIQEKLEQLAESKHAGMLLGVPSFNKRDDDERDYQGIDRVISGMLGDVWQLLVIAEPGERTEIREALDSLYKLSTTLHLMSKQTIQSAENSSRNISKTKGKTDSTTKTESTGTNSSFTQSDSHTDSITNTSSSSKTDTKSSGTSSSDADSNSKSQSTGTAKGTSHTSSGSSSSSGTSDNRTAGDSTTTGKSRTTGENKGTSSSSGTSLGRSEGDSSTKGTSSTTGDNRGSSVATGESWNISDATGETTGTGTTISFEHTNKQYADLVRHLDETLIPRFQLGRSKAMFKTAVYVFGENPEVLTRAGGLLRALFQGDDSYITPIEFRRLENQHLAIASNFKVCSMENSDRNQCTLHSVPVCGETADLAFWMTTRELSLVAGLPVCEVPGLRMRKSVDFGVNIPIKRERHANDVELGVIKMRGRKLDENPFVIDRQLLNGHVFVTGVTGAGKTTTCQKLLLESDLPFLVLEPAKTEYRELLSHDESILFFTPGDDSRKKPD